MKCIVMIDKRMIIRPQIFLSDDEAVLNKNVAAFCIQYDRSCSSVVPEQCIWTFLQSNPDFIQITAQQEVYYA